MKGELLLVECEPLGNAVELLQSAPDVIDAAVFGNALHLVVEMPPRQSHKLRSICRITASPLNHIEKIRPALEDVFVSLTTTSDSAEEAMA
jgi:ABC-2 type transport system ATP-binding protein